MKHTARILIVEDEVLLAKAMAEKFTREGFETLIAKDGKEGLASALENHPDLIILDIIYANHGRHRNAQKASRG